MTDKSTILVVDDDEIIRSTLEGLLLSQGHNLAFAEDGTKALTLAAELMPDLVLLDVMMPEMDGFEVCKRLRADPVLAEVPIIMITALDDRESRLAGIEAGADDFITKPFDSVELRLRVQTITRLNRYRRLMMERNKFKWVVQQASDGYLMLDTAGHILYLNSLAQSFLGLTDESAEQISEPFQSLAQKQYHCEPEAAWESWPQPPATPAPRYLVQPETATAPSFWLQVDVVEMSSLSDEKYLVRLHDITSTINAQRMVWTFHDQVSHKLRTPLSKLINSIKLLLDERADLSADEEALILSMADSSAVRLHQEVDSIFQFLNTFTVITPGQARCRLGEISPIVGDVETALELQNVVVFDQDRSNLPDSTPLAISRQAMELILWELLKNAQKFHPRQSPVIEVAISGTSAGVKIKITDDGLTLSTEQLSKMWTPYYQVEKHFSGQIPGMGLGLSMVSSLVWSVGGQCQAYNRAGADGITVELAVPVTQDDNESP